MPKPIGWKFRIEVPDCAAADVGDVVRAQIEDELARARAHVEVPEAELARIHAATDGAVAFVKRHPTGKAELELVEADDGRVQATVYHQSGHASGTLVVVPSLEQDKPTAPTSAASSEQRASAAAAAGSSGNKTTSPATSAAAAPPGPGLRRTGTQAKPFVPVASRVGGDNPTGGGPSAPSGGGPRN
jgi:hypothetical protein